MKNEITLDHGSAQPMGDGIYVICQHDEYGIAQSVVVSLTDLKRIQETEA